MPVQVVSAGPTPAGDEFEIVFESDSREELLDRSVYQTAIQEAARAGFGLGCAISRTPNIYPVDEEGKSINYPLPGRSRVRYRRVIACVPRL